MLLTRINFSIRQQTSLCCVKTVTQMQIAVILTVVRLSLITPCSSHTMYRTVKSKFYICSYLLELDIQMEEEMIQVELTSFEEQPDTTNVNRTTECGELMEVGELFQKLL